MNEFRSNEGGWQGQNWAGSGSARPRTAAEATVDERLGFVRKVYGLLFVSSLFGMFGVALGFMAPPLMIFTVEHPWLSFFILIGAVMGVQYVRLVPTVNILALFGFTTLTGILISPVVAFTLAKNPASLLQASVLTVAIFGSLTVYTFVSKKDFSFMRGMVVVGLVIVIVGGVLNLILASSALGFALAVAILVLFSGFILYDTSNIIRRYPTNEYVAGALSLYLDLFNVFLALLRILNAGRR